MHAIVFDFDGTLVDTEPLHEMALAEACRPHGVPVAHGSTIGLADEDALVNAFAAVGIQIDDTRVRELKRIKTGAYLRIVRDRPITVYPGAVELMRAAAAQELPVGICTAAVRPEVEAVLNRLGIADILRAVVTASEVSAKKPHPEGYEVIARRLGIEPARCIAIEDSPRGVDAALGAGMIVAGVAHTTDAAHLSHAHTVRDTIGAYCVRDLVELARKHNAPARRAHGGVG